MLVFWGRRDLLDISPTLTEAAGAIVDVKLLPFFLLYMHFYFSMEMIKIVFFFQFLIYLTQQFTKLFVHASVSAKGTSWENLSTTTLQNFVLIVVF